MSNLKVPIEKFIEEASANIHKEATAASLSAATIEREQCGWIK